RHRAALTGDHERLGDEHTNAAGAAAGAGRPAGARDVQALERGIVLDRIGRVAVRDLPYQFTLVEIDRADAAVRRLDQRQALDRHAAATAVFERGADADVGHVR